MFFVININFQKCGINFEHRILLLVSYFLIIIYFYDYILLYWNDFDKKQIKYGHKNNIVVELLR